MVTGGLQWFQAIYLHREVSKVEIKRVERKAVFYLLSKGRKLSPRDPRFPYVTSEN